VIFFGTDQCTTDSYFVKRSATRPVRETQDRFSNGLADSDRPTGHTVLDEVLDTRWADVVLDEVVDLIFSHSLVQLFISFWCVFNVDVRPATLRTSRVVSAKSVFLG
jgi:hypothetical protein